jgi:hypothetical protein
MFLSIMSNRAWFSFMFVLQTLSAAPIALFEQQFLNREASSRVFLGSSPRAATDVIVHTGQTLLLDGVPFYVPPDPLTSIPNVEKSLTHIFTTSALIPLSVFNSSSLQYQAEDLEDAVRSYTVRDDVFNHNFLQGKTSFLPFQDWRHPLSYG